jgi:hypothetical protein
MRRVNRPDSNRRPPTISNKPIAVAVVLGNGKPSFVNRPTPWFVYTNLRIPSERNTAPAIKRTSTVARGAVVTGLVTQLTKRASAFDPASAEMPSSDV